MCVTMHAPGTVSTHVFSSPFSFGCVEHLIDTTTRCHLPAARQHRTIPSSQRRPKPSSAGHGNDA